jgi:predicted flap endonuclease-1-like 5' DNA nuclease
LEDGMTKLVEIEGIGEKFAAAFASAGVETVEALLERGGTPRGRKELAEATGLSEARVLGFANRADLARVKGIGSEYADLLEAAGVDTVPELAQRNAHNLTVTLSEVNEAKKLVRKLPGRDQVADWIAQAKDLPRRLTY